MKQLSSGCYRSNITVSPANWNTKRASMNKYWRISYRFYDPALKDHPEFTKGKKIEIWGLNEHKDLEVRQGIVRALINREINMLDNLGYNPITGKFIEIRDEDDNGFSPYTPLIQALRSITPKITDEPNTLRDIKTFLKYFEKSAIQLDKAHVPVKDIKRKDLRLILDNCANVRNDQGKKKKWSNNQFNHYRKYLSMHYAVLEELEMVEYNPVSKIAKKGTIQKIKRVLTHEERRKIDQALREKNPTFHRFINIFFHSGARISELLNLTAKDVDLKRQVFKALIKKGKSKRWVEKTIKDVALPFWKDAMKDRPANALVFADDLRPSPTKIWKRLVKTGLKIDADLYSLKHLNSTEVVDAAGEETAAALNDHTTTAMVVNIYDTKQANRRHEKLKKISNSFA